MPIKLGNNTFNVPAPGAMKSFAFQQTVIPVATRMAGVFMHFLGITDGSVTKLADMDIAAVLPKAMPYLGEVFANMPAGELDKITRTLLGDATYTVPESQVALPLFGKNGMGDPFDALMAGRTMDVWQLLWHALEAWYPDFFTRGRALFVTVTKKENRSEASTT